MKRYNLEIGRLGEEIAREYLENRGYKVLEHNCRNKYGEIDLVSQDNDALVFIEVKTRIGERLGAPEDAINRNKIHRLIRNAQAYMAYRSNKLDESYRIDAVCIVLDENRQVKRIEHYQNITS